MVCLLHEKPFAGVNGSGKHNNWSITTNTGVNLLEPGDTPHENAQFLLMLVAAIKAVDDYQEMLRISVADAGNDLRLGAAEAPPAVMSIFLGDELTEILEAIEADRPYDAKDTVQMKIGVHALPKFPKDNTDRNRTSPFAFTGNKFEFRMAGSSQSIATANAVLNTAFAEVIRQFADILENADSFNETLHELIRKTIREHKRIIFNGNGYEDKWIEEAEKRGLANLRTTPDALPHMLDAKNIELFSRHGVFSEDEMRARLEIQLENYTKIIHIEALTMLDMARHDILPAASDYAARIAANADLKKRFGTADAEERLLSRLCALTDSFYANIERLEKAVKTGEKSIGKENGAMFYKNEVISAMNALRADGDALEELCDASCWPYPSYGDMLFSIK